MKKQKKDWRQELTDRVRKAIQETPEELSVWHRVTISREEAEKLWPKNELSTDNDENIPG
jgi:hypothetical protein